MKLRFIIFLILILSACSQTQEANQQVALKKNNKTVLETLYQRYQIWQGSPYQLGGNSQKGIDCSGFVTLTFQQEFNKQLPRTTMQQSKLEKEIDKGELRAGDLIFFKIIDKTNLRHVGIYLENEKFLHASTSKGVVISYLTTDYWSQNYWKSIRVLD